MGREPGIPECAFQNILGPVTSEGFQQRLLWIHWGLGREGPFGGHPDVGRPFTCHLLREGA